MTVETPPLPAETQRTERCTGCGNPLALDQRYCLNCGKRRGSTRVDFEKYLGAEDSGQPPKPPVAIAAPPAPDNRPEREVTPLMAAVGLTGIAVILILGVLIGRTGQSTQPAAAPVVAATGIPTATPSTTTIDNSTAGSTVSFTADWPTGSEGFTIELATLPKDTADGTAVETAKTDMLAKGAAEVGALDSDEYPSLPPGNYVLYSGVYDTQAEAEKALNPLLASFPDAQVIEVAATAESTAASEDSGGGGGGIQSGGEGAANEDEVVEASEDDLEALENATGEEYQEFQEKLPPTIETPGEAPPVDSKPAGAGGDAVEIG